MLDGSGALPDSVTLTTSRSAAQTNGLASGTRRLSSLTSRTPGTVSTAATALQPAVLGERFGGESDVAACNRDALFVEDRVLDRGIGAGRKVSLDGRGAGPGGETPKDEQRNDARPPFAAPPEKSAHPGS